MPVLDSNYINGRWQRPEPGAQPFKVVHPGNEEVIGQLMLGTSADVDKAVGAAKAAFATWQFSTKEDRIELLQKIYDLYHERSEEFASAMSREMGTCLTFSRESQAPCGDGHITATIEALKHHQFVRPSLRGGSTLVDEPVGVCGLITPWNWPVNQVIVKVAPALAAGCTMILKPSEYSPISAALLAEVIHEAGCPDGVFNMVQGDGERVGAPLTIHPDVDMISFTGSTRAGVAISRAAAESVKKVALELGGKSANIVFDDADLENAAAVSVDACFNNNGQSCDASSRLLVQRGIYEDFVERVAENVRAISVDNPMHEGDHLGPVVNRKQFEHIQHLIQVGINEGARLVVGGPGLPEGFDRGYYIRPTLFADVTNDMAIATEEVFGPVLAILPFETEDEAIEIANDSVYGLSAYVQSTDRERIERVCRQLRVGSVNVNGAVADYDVPFGGYKRSGNGKENGIFALEEYLETKALNM